MNTFLQSILHLDIPFNWLSLMGLSLFAFGTIAAIVTQVRKFAVHVVDTRFKRDLVTWCSTRPRPRAMRKTF